MSQNSLGEEILISGAQMKLHLKNEDGKQKYKINPTSFQQESVEQPILKNYINENAFQSVPSSGDRNERP